MKNKLHKLLHYEQVRYVFAGGLTTGVNFVAFTLLLYAALDYRIANTVAFFVATLFAYYVNEGFVFKVQRAASGVRLKRVFYFIMLRTGSYVADMVLLILLVSVWGLHALLSKMIVNVVVIILNYVISKFHIFKGVDSH